jgi:SAM-dependent methyltransferase
MAAMCGPIPGDWIVKQAFSEARLEDKRVGSQAWFDEQRALIKSRPLVRHHYDLWYRKQLADEASVPAGRSGLLVELGSGGSYLKELEPSVLTSDVEEGIAEQVIDGRKLPFADNSVRALFLSHVFHHIPDVGQFLAEAQRVLVPGGVISLVEVANTPMGSLVFRYFHPEPFKPEEREWNFQQSSAMMDANQALAWMVFVRDRAKFVSRFPELRLETTEYLPWFSYLVSGGVTRKPFVPESWTSAILGLDRVLAVFGGMCALHWHLRIRKVDPGQT